MQVDIYGKKLNTSIKIEESFCKKKCENCVLDKIPNPYTFKKGTYYIVILVPIHENNISDHFTCSQSLNFESIVDLIEAAKFAIQTSLNPDLGLIIIDTCSQPLVTIEKLISINYTNVLGVIGGYYSMTTIPAAEVLTRLQIPQISYGAEAHVLSDRSRFPYVQRIITSTEEKSKAIILLCKRMKWKAINVMYNKESFGISGQSLLLKYAKIHGICIVNNIKVELGEHNFQIYLNQLRKTSKVKIVVIFLLRKSYSKWLSILNEDQEDNEFLFIDAYGQGDSDVRKILKNNYKNQVILEVNKRANKEFLDYYANLTKSDIEKNPWAKNFIEKRYKCRFFGSFNIAFERECNYKVKMDSISTYHSLVIQSIYALINGTVCVFNNRCILNAENVSKEIRKTKLNISGKVQKLFDEDENSQIHLYCLLRVKTLDPFEYEMVTLSLICYYY